MRGFGSRRHYDFSSDVYLEHCRRIVDALATRYGTHPAVCGWQTDNELCCHDTTLSASPAARDRLRLWCRDRYGTIEALNAAWGNAFWSMDYRGFDEIELPVLAVTETNPAHRLAWRRFASDEVVRFHDAQVAIIRRASPGRFVTHNFIPMDETGIDNRALARGLDFASYDNYPLGRTDLLMAQETPETFRPFMRTGHPDFNGLLFDWTRGLAPGSGFWVMEQQPGPVNWANHNPRPAPGMVRLWTLEAFAHGAAVVSYFRWRQARFAQEQMHAGLRRPDDSPAEAWPEIEAVAAELARLKPAASPSAPARVALLADVEAQWVGEIERQGSSYRYPAILMDHYRALRGLGLDVDIVGRDSDFAGYALIVIPSLPNPSAATVERLDASGATVVFGPRSGSKSAEFSVAEGLPPGEAIRSLLPLRVLCTETLRPDCPEPLHWNGSPYPSLTWRETLEPGIGVEVTATYGDGAPAMVRRGRVIYLATLSDRAFLADLFESLCAEAGVATVRLPETLRLRRRGALTFAMNYADRAVAAPAPAGATFILGGATIGPRDAAVWIQH